MAFLIGGSGVQAPNGSYSTTFSGGNENPIDEDGVWVNGNTVGLDWGDVAITNGIAHGKHVNEPFSDPTAILTGTFSADQECEGVIQGVDTQGASCGAEVELRLRSVVSANVNRGYELLYSTRTTSTYMQLVRWDGPVGEGNFEVLATWNLPTIPAPANGYKVKYRCTGEDPTTHTVWVYDNDAEDNLLFTDTFSETVSVWTDGNPGMGFWIGSDCLGTLDDEHLFGFTSFSASNVA